VPDPAAVQGSDDAKRKAFLTAFAVLSTRINYLLALPIEKLDRLALKARLAEIGTRTPTGDRGARTAQGAGVSGPVS
jgi:arsenate reductase